jgi:8-oxo-dGTP pyrophosphatase MutT (NUDIX family)
MEIIDLYDHHRIPTGMTQPRGQAVPAGYYRAVVHICVFNSQGQLLIQQRQNVAPSYPGYWDVSVGGGVSQGETPQAAAQRELWEELGLQEDFSLAVPAVTVRFSDGFDDFFIAHRDAALEELTLQPREVQDARWAGLDEILSMIDQGTFIPYRKSFVDFLFHLSVHAGTHNA